MNLGDNDVSECRFVSCNKYTILVQDVAGKEAVCGQRIYGNSILSLNFSVNLIIITTTIIIKSIDQASISLAKKSQFHLLSIDNFFPPKFGS